jgi:hypothetical protein
MTISTRMPDDDELERLALESLPVVLDRIRTRPARRRRSFVLAASAVLVAGASFAAVTLAVDPGDGIDTTGTASVFALDCTDAHGAVVVSNVYSSESDVGAAATDPVGTCVGQERSNAISDAVTTAAWAQQAAGGSCGIVLVDGVTGDAHRWEWESDPSDTGPGIGTTDGTASPDDQQWTASCAQSVTTIAEPTMPPSDQVACARAANWAVVSVADGRSEGDVCAARGYAPWH